MSASTGGTDAATEGARLRSSGKDLAASLTVIPHRCVLRGFAGASWVAALRTQLRAVPRDSSRAK